MSGLKNNINLRGLLCSLASLGVILIADHSSAGNLEQAKRIHDRVAGVPPTETVLNQMAGVIASPPDGKTGGVAAAEIAMENDNFYNVTLKTLVTPWTNEEQDPFVALNDYTATVIGIVANDLDFRTILTTPNLYVARSSLGLPAYSPTNNAHYEALEERVRENRSSLKDDLEAVSQASVVQISDFEASGVVTSRASAKAFFSDGTNRSQFQYIFLNHMCIEVFGEINDAARVVDRIRQDVSRSPGGDSRVYLNFCMGCHSGMDPLIQGLAYYDYDNNLEKIDFNGPGIIDPDSGSRVQGKYLINSNNFPYGYAAPDNKWDNYWREGTYRSLGWDWTNEGLPGNGYGAESLMTEISHSKTFAQCHVSQVFETVCLREPQSTEDHEKVSAITDSFRNNGFNFKTVFAESADYCKGE